MEEVTPYCDRHVSPRLLNEDAASLGQTITTAEGSTSIGFPECLSALSLL